MSKKRKGKLLLAKALHVDRIVGEVILEKVAKQDNGQGCWFFIGYTDDRGYGQCWYNGRAHWIHRVICAAFHGDLLDNQDVHHTCRNASCIRPAHLTVKPSLTHRTKHHTLK